MFTSISTEYLLGCGHIHVTVGHNGTKALKVLALLGKAGSCTHCMLEALSDSISLGLRYGVPVGEYIDRLRGIRCPAPTMWPEEERILSCADGIAKALKEFS